MNTEIEIVNTKKEKPTLVPYTIKTQNINEFREIFSELFTEKDFKFICFQKNYDTFHPDRIIIPEELLKNKFLSKGDYELFRKNLKNSGLTYAYESTITTHGKTDVFYYKDSIHKTSIASALVDSSLFNINHLSLVRQTISPLKGEIYNSCPTIASVCTMQKIRSMRIDMMDIVNTPSVTRSTTQLIRGIHPFVETKTNVKVIKDILNLVLEREDFRYIFCHFKHNVVQYDYISIPLELLQLKLGNSYDQFRTVLKYSGVTYTYASHIKKNDDSFVYTQDKRRLYTIMVKPELFYENEYKLVNNNGRPYPKEMKIKVNPISSENIELINQELNSIKIGFKYKKFPRINTDDSPLITDLFSKDYKYEPSVTIKSNNSSTKEESLPSIEGPLYISSEIKHLVGFDPLKMNTNFKRSLFISFDNVMNIKILGDYDGISDTISGILYTCNKDIELVSLLAEMEQHHKEKIKLIKGNERFLELNLIWGNIKRVRELILGDWKVDYVGRIIKKHFPTLTSYIKLFEIFSRISPDVFEYVNCKFEYVKNIVMDKEVIDVILSDLDGRTLSTRIMNHINPEKITKSFTITVDNHKEDVIEFINQCSRRGKHNIEIIAT